MKRDIRSSAEISLYRIDAIELISEQIIECNADLYHTRRTEATGDQLTDFLAAHIHQAAVNQMMREMREAFREF